MAEAAKNAYKINQKQCRIVYEILRLNALNINDAEEYKTYRLCVKKRLNVPYHKQKEDLKKMEKRGVDVTAAAATVPSSEERIDKLKEEYEVGLGIDSFILYGFFAWIYMDFLMNNGFFCWTMPNNLLLSFQAHEEEYFRIINRLKAQALN